MDFDSFPTKRRDITLNLTAMIDIIMVLLLFFITTTTFSKLGIKINQPASSQSKAIEKIDLINVGINKKGQFFIDETPVSQSELKEMLSDMKSENPNIAIVLNPDKETQTQFLIDALDSCKEVGIEKISIASKKKNE